MEVILLDKGMFINDEPQFRKVMFPKSTHLAIEHRVMLAASVLTGNGFPAFRRVSKRGVPHVVARNKTFSVTWFQKARTWRLFTPYNAEFPDKHDFYDLNELVDFLMEEKT